MTEGSHGSNPIPGLAVAITAKDSHRTITRTLDSVKPIAKRIVVVDSGSSDGTVEVCRSLGAEVIHQEWQGHVRQKQYAIDCCREHAWVLLLDSDESLDPDLSESIRRTVETDDPSCDGWFVNRKVFFLGGWLHHTYQPEWRLRLVRGGRATVAGVSPHDRLEVPGRTGRLRGDLRHDSWAGVGDLARRSIAYAELAADSAKRGGSMFHLLVNPYAAAFKQLVLRGGLLDGRRGLIVAALTFNFTLLKHACIAANRLKARRGES